jgi:hypothetical protein
MRAIVAQQVIQCIAARRRGCDAVPAGYRGRLCTRDVVRPSHLPNQPATRPPRTHSPAHPMTDPVRGGRRPGVPMGRTASVKIAPVHARITAA